MNCVVSRNNSRIISALASGIAMLAWWFLQATLDSENSKPRQFICQMLQPLRSIRVLLERCSSLYANAKRAEPLGQTAHFPYSASFLKEKLNALPDGKSQRPR